MNANLTTISATTTCLLAACLPAQEPSRSLFAGAPVMVSLDETTSTSFAPDEAYLKRPGFNNGSTPANWSASSVPTGVPSFDLRAIFKNCRAQKPLDVDALSIGEDWIISDPCNGKAKMPNGRWATLSFSVTRKTQGKPGSVIRSESGTPDGAAADMFTFVLPGSAMPPAEVGITRRSIDSREMDLGGGAGTKARNVNALDQFIPLYTLEPGIAQPTPTGMMPAQLNLFFSLTSASALAAPAAWFGPEGPSGATILKVSYVAGRGWTCPAPFITYKELTLSQKEDVDAIAVDLINKHLLFSTDISLRARNPLLFYSWAPGCFMGGIHTYTDELNSIPISDEMGLVGSDDIDAICAMDPSIRSRGSRRNPVYHVYGTPRPPLGIFAPQIMQASAVRDFAGGAPRFKTWISGWPNGGSAAPGTAGLFVTPANMYSPFILLGIFARNPASPVAGAPVEVDLPMPVASSLTGLGLDLHWFANETGSPVLGEAYPLLIRL